MASVPDILEITELLFVSGFLYAIEALKSAILTHTCVERRLRVDQAVLLSRLEEEYQVKFLLLVPNYCVLKLL